jgi:hypothetical protein
VKFKIIYAAAAAGLALAMAGTEPAQAASGPVSSNPANWTPWVTSADSYVRQLAQCGSTMYAVGTFTSIRSATGQAYTRNRAFSFNATTGAVSSWNPNVNGVVNSVAFNSTCSNIYLGGQFTSVGGVSATNIVKVSASSGAVDGTFAHSAGGQVEALQVYGSELLVGGYFTGINGTARPYLASLNAGTGRVDSYLNLNISGHYPGNPNPTRVYNFALSHGGNKLLVMGDFTSVAGQHREQMFMLDLGSTSATLDAWYSPNLSQHCADVEPYYVKAAAWSPDDSRVYIATTGYKPPNSPGPGGLCDAAAAFSSASVSTLTPLWINYTGCDSYYAVEADASSVYVGGHERWANNRSGCDVAGSGAVSRPGIGAINPVTGSATSWNPTRDRGKGADDMVVTSAGLWVASDTYFGSAYCGHEWHPGICFFPFA